MDHDHVELQSYRGRASLAPPLDQTDHAAAARLVRSCLARPYKLRKGEPWPRDPPVKPHPRTVWYETRSAPPPLPAAAALAPRSASPDRTSASNRTRTVPDLPEFHHWRQHDSSARRPGLTRSKGDEHNDTSISTPSAASALPSQGILRKRPPPAAVAGAWAPTSGSSALLPQSPAHDEPIIGARRLTTTALVSSGGGSDRTPGQKKQVRVESPRTTEARTATASATTLLPSSSRSPRRGATTTATTTTGRPTTELAAASRRDKIVPVPRSSVRPRPSSTENDDGRGGDRSAATATPRPSRGIGAIERCIPPPYAHRVLDPLLNPVTDAYDLNPARQEPSAVLHSFVDPDYARRRRTSSEEAGTGEGAPELPLSSPATMEFLAPGRRGAWLIPISEGEGPVPPFASPAIWPADEQSRSSGSRAAKTTTTRTARSTDGEGPAVLPLEWTDARLVVLWIYLTSLHEGRGFGNIRAQVIWGAGGGSTPGDLLKINCDAHLALAIRGLLDRLNVRGVAKRVGGGGGGGGGGGDSANERLERLKREGACNDDEKWFKGRALVWVDEQSRAILTA